MSSYHSSLYTPSVTNEAQPGVPLNIFQPRQPYKAAVAMATLPVWQLCSQTRCPSYLQRHRIMLLEKSDSATSFVGFTTTCSEGDIRVCDVVSE